MSDETKVDYLAARLRHLAALKFLNGSDTQTFLAAADELARLQAEVERLTPRVMTLEGLARELNDFRYDDSDKWSVQDGGLVCGNDCECFLDPIHAISIVRFLRRDAAEGGAV